MSVDLSVEFFGALIGEPLRAGHFGVANCFVPTGPTDPSDAARRERALDLVGRSIAERGCEVLLVRDVPVDHTVARPAAERHQLPIVQWVFRAPESWERAYADDTHAGLYPLSLSARTQVLKGRLNSREVIGYFRDLLDPRHSVRTLYFHTRFSTNTEPHPTMAQPFRLMAHNGELNTDPKNRLTDEALTRVGACHLVRSTAPHGPTSAIDLDDGQGRCVALITQFGIVGDEVHEAWEHLTAALPDAR